MNDLKWVEESLSEWGLVSLQRKTELPGCFCQPGASLSLLTWCLAVWCRPKPSNLFTRGEVPNFGCLHRIPRYGERMSKATKLLHTRYRVNDLEKTVKFYKDVLGLEETRRHKSPRGSELVFMKAPGSEELIELCYFPASGPVQVQADLTHLAFEVGNLQEFGKHLAAYGLKFSDGPHMKPDGGGIAFVDAPEGYEIELIQMAKSGAGY
jgi:lactoylglutathione lyase